MLNPQGEEGRIKKIVAERREARDPPHASFNSGMSSV